MERRGGTDLEGTHQHNLPRSVLPLLSGLQFLELQQYWRKMRRLFNLTFPRRQSHIPSRGFASRRRSRCNVARLPYAGPIMGILFIPLAVFDFFDPSPIRSEDERREG